MNGSMLFRGVAPTVTNGADFLDDIFSESSRDSGSSRSTMTAGSRFETAVNADDFDFDAGATALRTTGSTSGSWASSSGLSGIGSGGWATGGGTGGSIGGGTGGGGTGGSWVPGVGWVPNPPPDDGGDTGGGTGGGGTGGGTPPAPVEPLIVTMMVDGIERSFGIIPPENFDADMIYSCIMTFHGGGTTGRDPDAMSGLTGFSDFGNQPQFIEVYPIAAGDTWGWDPKNSPYDDVGFIEALVDELTTNWSVDADNIYAAGMSAGGMMVQSLALEVPDLFAGYAVVAANMMSSMEAEAVASVADVPMVIFHGSEDPTQPYNGIIDRRGNTIMYGSEDSAAYWAEQNDTTMGAYVALPDTADDGMTVMMASSLDGSIEHYIVVGGGHSWPGSSLSEATQDIDASELMIEFFQDQGFYY